MKVGHIPSTGLNQTLWKVVSDQTSRDVSWQSIAPDVMEGLRHIQGVYREFMADLQSSPSSPETVAMLLKGLKGFEDSIYPRDLNQPPRHISEAEMAILNVCGTLIPNEGELKKSDIEEIRSSIQELRKAVEDGDISPTLRKILLELIRISDDAISRYNINGPRGLQRAVKRMVGEAFSEMAKSDSKEREQLFDSPNWQLVLKHLRIVDGVAGKILEYKPLIDSAIPYLITQGNGN